MRQSLKQLMQRAIVLAKKLEGELSVIEKQIAEFKWDEDSQKTKKSK